uniref:Kazal type serine protease inhibitor-like venom protein n=1 Tax=Pachycrepoideus vindemmiae TaxID=632107 RepID=A0A8F6T7F9_9HYME|nr:Kazal type serine protease inhibitor-like venom protein [Pachycrepoideus vindemmiae]
MMKLRAFLFATALFCVIVNINAQIGTDEYEDDIDDCPCVASLNWDPKCGSDGKTYPNQRSIECHNECKRDDYITVVYDGECKEGDYSY